VIQRINLRLLAFLALGTAVTAGATVGVHEWQVQRHAGFYLNLAREAREREKPHEAVSHFRRYLQFAPGDAEARAECGLLLADMSMPRQAFAMLERAVREAPDRREVRVRLVEVLRDLGRHRDALEHIAVLSMQSALDGKLLELKGRCHAALEEYPAAMASLKGAVEGAPDRLEAYGELARLLRDELDRPREGDQWMERLVQSNPRLPRALVLRGRYLREIGQPERAAEDADRALRLAPEDREALLLAVRCQLDTQSHGRAEEYARRGLDHYPEHALMYVALADVRLAQGRPEDAVAALRAGLKRLPGDRILLRHLAELLLAQGRFDAARATVQELVERGCPASLIAFLRGRAALGEGRLVEALEALKRARGELARRPDLAKDVDRWLGHCYGRLHNVDRQIAAYRRAVTAQRQDVAARLDLARALAEAGRLDEALAVHQETMTFPRAPEGGWLQLAELRLRKNLALPEAQRQWAGTEEALAQAAAVEAEAPELALLRAELFSAQGRHEEARALIAGARSRHPQDAALWAAEAVLAARQGNRRAAEQILAEAERVCGDRVSLRLARARAAVDRHGAEAAGELHRLARGAGGLPRTERVRLWREAVGLCLQIGAAEEAESLCRMLLEEIPQDLEIRLLQFELALRRGDERGMDASVQAIHRIEHEGPMWHYAQAARLRWLADQGHPELLDQAERHTEKARNLRPNWAPPLLVAAAIHEKKGRADVAIEEYRQAIHLGEPSRAALGRAVRLLNQRERYSEAIQLIRQAQQRAGNRSMGLGRLESEVRLRQGDLQGALDTARLTALESTDYRDRLWQGQLLAMAGQVAQLAADASEPGPILREAEEAFRGAVELEGSSPEPWVALVQFLTLTGRLDEAKAAIGRATERIAPDARPAALASCYLTVGEPERAVGVFDEALRLQPNSPRLLHQAAELYLRAGAGERAESSLRCLLRRSPGTSEAERRWARRTLALLLGSRGGFRNLTAALELVNENLGETGPEPVDLSVKARLLAAHPSREQRKRAVSILEELREGGRDLGPGEASLLLRLYLREGQWVRASRQMRRLLASHGTNPRYVATYVRSLLDRDEVDEAAGWLQHLKSVAPDAWGTIRLNAELLVRQKRPDDALELLRNALSGEQDDGSEAIGRQLRVAESLALLARRLRDGAQDTHAAAFAAEAEALYRAAVEQEPGHAILLASFLAQAGRLDEALDVLEGSWTAAEPGRLAETLIRIAPPAVESADRLGRIGAVVERALEKHDRQVALLLVLAEIRTRQQRFDQAERIYREVIQRHPKSSIARNNLAMLLALQGRGLPEARELIGEAIQIAGPMGELLDSRAVVWLASEEPRRALADLKRAIAEGPTAVRYFHSAQVHQELGDGPASAEARKKARELGLQPADLHPLESAAYRRMLE